MDLKIVSPNRNLLQTTAVILEKVPIEIPTQKIKCIDTKALKDVSLADPTFGIPNSVDIIIGSDLFEQTVGDEKRSLGNGPFARRTLSDLVLSGIAKFDTPQTVHVFDTQF